MKRVELCNGTSIPAIGYGTWKAPRAEITVQAITDALECGCIHIDSATRYGNQVYVGQGIAAGLKATGLKREDIFVTSKLWNTVRGYEETLAAFEESITDLGLDYVDLYLIHWPVPNAFRDNYIQKNAETWKAMEKLYKEGKCKAIGVSNFKVHHIEELLKTAEIKPMVNQVEFHPGCGLALQEDIAYCEKMGIVVTGYSPLANGRIFEYPEVVKIAEKLGVSVSQLCMKYLQQKNVIPIFKSVHKERILENLNLDFTISQADMELIDALKEPGLLNDSDCITFSETAPPVF